MGKWLKTTELIRFDVQDRVARITLNRPDKRNALSTALVRELHDALWEADDRTDVNVIILEGAGKDFCAGYDLVTTYSDRKADDTSDAPAQEVVYRSAAGTYDDDCWQMEATQRLTNALFDLHKPVIAKIQGNCLAGGTDLAFMCDMVIAAEDARIGFPATRANGTPPTHMWVYHLGPQWAKRMLMTGDCLHGRDAARVGLVLDAVPADQLDAAVNELARRVSFVDSEMLAAHKRVVNMALEIQGARTLQRCAVEMDARGHLSKGPRRTQFKQDMATVGLKQALKNRDEPFGDGMVKAHWLSK
jgi:enoyl-CoA hydratase